VKEETRKWLTLYEEDRRIAEVALEARIFRQCVHHSQQMLEKVLKALWIELDFPAYPPASHSLLRLAREMGVEIDDGTAEFLEDLTGQYLPTRYGDVMVDYSQDQAEFYFQRATEICRQLLQGLS
jgi:HEPN domain-containing protein